MIGVTANDEDLGWTTEQVARITGASERRLGYWLGKGIIAADVDEARGRGRVRLWSFANLVDVRVAMWLRDRLSLEVIASIIAQLRGNDVGDGDVRFAVVDTGEQEQPTKVVLRSDGGDQAAAAGSFNGEVVIDVVVPIGRFVAEMRDASNRDGAKRRRVKVEKQPDPPPIITRVSASAIRALYYEGWPAQRIIDTFPGLTAHDVREAMRGRRTQ